MITLNDLIERFGETELIELTDKQHCQAINSDVIGHAISDAVAEVVSYLNPTGLIANGIYIGTPPKSLVVKTCDIARYYLHENGATQIVEQRYRQAIDWLLLAQKNPAMLTGTANKTTNTKSNIAVIANPKPSIWG